MYTYSWFIVRFDRKQQNSKAIFFFFFFFFFSEIRIATSAFLWFPFAWNIFFRLFTFGLYMSLGLKWVSCRQHMYGSSFCIQSASLCLFVGVYNPFTFKVIIDIYIYIFLLTFLSLFWVCLCKPFLSLVFITYISPLNICCKVGLVILNSLNFCLSVKLWISPSILNEILDE